MQIGAAEDRITAAGHALKRQIPLTAEQLVVQDLRLRNWRTAVGAPSYAAPGTDYTIQSDAELGDGILKGTDFWDLGYQNLGVNTPVTLPDETTRIASLSYVTLDANTDLVCFYAENFRSNYDGNVWGMRKSGIYVMRVVDDGAGHLYWNDPKPVFFALANDESNQDSLFYVTFPRLLEVGDEYWITALECSKYAGHVRYHLCYFRSADGEHWSDRQYLAGVSPDSDQTRGIYKYDTDTPFVFDDLADAQLVVDGLYVYLLSPEGPAFYTDATALVGVDNPLKQLDVTKYATGWRLSLSQAPSAVQGNTTLKNPGGILAVNGTDDILRRGARLIRKAGYRTSAGSELVTLATEYLDEIPNERAVGKNDIELVSQDAFKFLRDTALDWYVEYHGPQQLILNDFCDFSTLNIVNGSFRINNAARLWAGKIEEDSPYPDDLAYVNFDRATDGVMEFRFKQVVSWTDHYVGIAFCGQDEKNYWAVTYNKKNTQKFQLRKVIPYPKKRAQRKLKYMAAVAASDVIAIETGHWRWIRVQVWHGHVQAFYSSDHANWTKVIDYVSPDSPDDDVVVPDAGYWGLIGCSTMEDSGLVGNTAANNGPYLLADDTNQYDLALRFRTGSYPSYLKQIGVVLAQTNLPPDVLLAVLYDPDGSGAAPPDATDEENVLFSRRIKSTEFDAVDSVVISAAGVNVPAYRRLNANAYYWIWIHPVKAPASGQEWKWYSIDPAANTYGTDLTRVSDDGGATWASLDDTGKNLAAFVRLDYDKGTARYRELNVASGRMPHTLEQVALDIAAKAGILEGVTLDAAEDALLGDCVFEADVDLSGDATITLRGTDGYSVTFKPATQTLAFHAAGALLGEVDSLQYFETGTPFHLTLVHHKDAIYVYLNRCLATIWFVRENERVTTLGYPATSGSGTFTNTRVPDLHRIQEYVALEADQTPADALEQLLAKKDVLYFVDYAGRLRIGSYRARALADTYTDTVVSAATIQTDADWASQYAPQGERYATRWDADMLDADGRRYRHEDYTDAFTDEDAWDDAERMLRKARELDRTGSLASPMVPTVEREDRIQAPDETGALTDWIVTSIEFQRSGPAKLEQTLNVRSYADVDAVEIPAVAATDALTDDSGIVLTGDDGIVLIEG